MDPALPAGDDIVRLLREHRNDLDALAKFICSHRLKEKVPGENVLAEWDRIQADKHRPAGDEEG